MTYKNSTWMTTSVKKLTSSFSKRRMAKLSLQFLLNYWPSF